ncbi:radical SAM protein [Siminovitchia acidinfaciens]|uniref:Radical SAM protein n=2 Tax=Siminovitchia acidinfaciens TaxID=2321395 RepID=A0A429XUN7_9BACI|nr:radical SAM protein [Siminovitchia acidinfaciens]
MIQLHQYESFTKVEGPGHRICIWVQGCPLRCENCFNEETWSMEGGSQVKVEDLFQRMMHDVKRYPSIEGVTFLGGEPFLQANPLALLGKMLRGEGLSIMTFSGFTYEAIQKANRSDWNELLGVTDLLIDGPYIDALHDLSRPWVGSLNQKYRFLTSKYAHLKDELRTIQNKVEVHVHPDGSVHINGIARKIDLEQLKNLLNI